MKLRTSNRTIEQQVVHLISRLKRVTHRQLRPNTHLEKRLGFDTKDLVDVIWEVERHFHITIPDEVPLHTVGDFVQYVNRATSQSAAA